MTRSYVDTGAIYRVRFTRDFGDRTEEWTQGPYATKGAARGQATYECGISRGYTVTAMIEETITDWHELKED